MKTSASFDVGYVNTSLTLQTFQDGGETRAKNLSSNLGIDFHYNLALYDYKTVVGLSFTQFASSNLGRIPISRLGFGVAYHFLRVNGQRLILESEVEGQVWGISPAVELSMGINKLSINDPSDNDLAFTASTFDLMPRLIVEIPLTTKILLIFSGGYWTSASLFAKDSAYAIKYSGSIFGIAMRLTTL